MKSTLTKLTFESNYFSNAMSTEECLVHYPDTNNVLLYSKFTKKPFKYYFGSNPLRKNQSEYPHYSEKPKRLNIVLKNMNTSIS